MVSSDKQAHLLKTMPRPLPSPRPAAVRQKHWSESRTFGAAVVLLLLMVSAAVWWLHVQSAGRLRAEFTSQVQLRAAQVTSATSAAVSVLFRTVDATAQELAAGHAQSGPRGFDERARRAIERLPAGAVTQVAVIGADGYLAYSNLGTSERVFLGDREHFKVHQDSGLDQLFISKPLLGRVSKQWSIQFSRPILRDGRFDGVVVLSVSPSYLQQAVARVALGSDDAITVLRQSGEFLARNREMDAWLGQRADPSRPFLAANAPATGSYEARSAIDKIDRLSRWQRLPDYPVLVVLGLSTATTFEPLERANADDDLFTAAALAALWIAGLGMAWLARRVSAQVRQREAAEFAAMHDALTGLHSRHVLTNHLQQAIDQAALSGERLGVLFLDLDALKPVNDRYGHSAGDEVLKAVAGRIQGCVRGDDLVARIGGDEFVVVVHALQDDDALVQLHDRIHRSLEAPIAAGGVRVRMGLSIGRAVYPEDGSTAEVLLHHADQAMYAQKARHGRMAAIAA